MAAPCLAHLWLLSPSCVLEMLAQRADLPKVVSEVQHPHSIQTAWKMLRRLAQAPGAQRAPRADTRSDSGFMGRSMTREHWNAVRGNALGPSLQRFMYVLNS